MLIVLDGAPCTSPTETMLDEESVAEVGGVDDRHGDVLATIGAVGGIGLGVGRLDLAVVEVHVGVVEGVDVDGKSLGVFGEFCGA